MNDIMRRAAALVEGPENYSRNAVDSVFDPHAVRFSASGLLERANTLAPQGKPIRRPGPAGPLMEAKEILCRAIGFPHIDMWEHAARPDWRCVKNILNAASNLECSR